MSSKLSSYSHSPFPIRSPLFKNPPESVPPTDDLEALQVELELLKQRTLERAKKAGEDLKSIGESMKRMKEREKGKAKSIDKVKRERDFTPSLDADEPAFSHAIVKSRFPSIGSVPPSSSRSSLDPRRIGDDAKKKKKKRKRDMEDSDIEVEPQRSRKTSPPLQYTHPHPSKISKATVSTHSHSKSLPGPDFSIPPPYPLLSPRPPIPPPPVPGPSRATEVMEDFSKLKQPSQVLVNTFYASIEPWIRSIKEEDIGFLEFTGDELEPYIMPQLGRPYAEVWEEEDTALYGGPMPGFTATRGPQGSSSAPVPKWDPSTLMEPDLVTEEKGHGPLTERLISALLPMPDMTVWKGVKAAEDAMEGRPGGSGAAAARREKMNVSDLEDRVRNTMRFHGLLDGTPDYSEKVDDPIATALRHAQRELRTVVAANMARRERLAAIARDRLAYQEYLDLRDSIDKNIWTTFSKLQKKDGPKLTKKKKKVADINGSANGVVNGTGVPGPSPAAFGLMTDEECRLSIPEPLHQLVETRRQWVDVVGSVFEQKQRENPGRIWGLPKKSVYEGIEEDIRRGIEQSMLVSRGPDPDQRTNKGKGKATGDEMDVG